MAFTVVSNSNMMSNDVHFECRSTDAADVSYQVFSSLPYVLLYQGYFFIKDYFKLELKELFDTEKKVPETPNNILEKYLIIFSIVGGGSVVKKFTVFYGGISRIMKRNLANFETDIFTKKLFNYRNNFFLTSRTSKRIITIPENEIDSLYFYASAVDLYFVCENTVCHRLYVPSDSVIINEPVDLQSIRQRCFNENNLLPNYFEVKNGNDFSDPYTVNWNEVLSVCRIVITEAKPADFYIRFLNSWGVYETIALYSVLEYTPVFEEQEDFVEYDSVILDYLNIQIRKTSSNEFTASIFADDTDRKNFVLDMLLSDSVFFVAYGMAYSSKVTLAGEGAYDKSYLEANAIQVKITLNDTEQFLSSTDFDEDVNGSLLPLLANNNTAILTNSGKNIFIKQYN